MERTIRVVIADDNEAVRKAVRSLLQTVQGVTVIAETARGDDAVTLAVHHRPDVMLMDISMPGLNGLQATQQISLRAPDVRVIILTAHCDQSYVDHALQVGAAGFLVKAAAATELPEALKTVTRGGRFMSSLITRGNR